MQQWGLKMRSPLPPWHFLLAIPKGMEAGQDIIFLIFLVGGVIAILRQSGAIDAALHGAVARLGKSPWILIGGCLLLFSIGAYTIGMGEEYVPLVPIIVTMSLAMRMDAIVAMGMVWVPYGIGWGCAGINPFGVIIAQNIAGVPLTSGSGASPCHDAGVSGHRFSSPVSIRDAGAAGSVDQSGRPC